MTGRDCADYVERAIASLASQSLDDVHVLFVDDASDDGTAELAAAALDALLPGRHTLRQNASPQGKAANAATHLRDLASSSTFVAVVDADDELVTPEILGLMAERYATGYDVVWTDYVTSQGEPGGNRPLDPFRPPREQGWCTSHLFSFRGLLWERVPDAYLQSEDGAWLRSAADFAIAYPVLDQTRRYAHLPIPAYRYTTENPTSHHNRSSELVTALSSAEQVDNAKIVLDRTPLECWRYPAEVPAVMHEAISLQLQQHVAAINSAHASVQRTDVAVQRLPQIMDARDRLIAEGVPDQWLRAVGGWSLDVELIDRIAATLDLHERPSVLELGSGAGTKVLAQLVANRGGLLRSVEHDPEWQLRTSAELSHHGLSGVAEVHLCPLVDVSSFGVDGLFYDLDGPTSDERYDVVIVDGPPSATNPLARLPALPAVSELLDGSSFHIFLDDYERPDEQRIVDVWRRAAPGLRYETLTFAKHAAVIRSPLAPPVPEVCQQSRAA